MKKIIFLLLIICFPITFNVNAEDNSTFTINCDNKKINVNDQIVCRTSVNSTFNYDKIKFKYEITDGLSLEDVRSNYEAIWKLSNKNNIITAKVDNGTIQSGLQEFGILLIKSVKSGKQTIKISDIVLENTKDNTTENIKETNTEIKVISSDNELKAININDKPIDNFLPKTTDYTININDDKKIKIEAFSSNEFATISGIGEYDLDEKNNNYIFPIIVTSEAGTNRIYTLTVVRSNAKDDGIAKKLKSLIIKDKLENTILFDFNSEQYYYDIDLKSTDTMVDIIPELSDDSLSFVKNYGKQTLKLVSGDNIVLIEIIDQNGQTKTYVINITKPLSNKSDDSYLSTLLIKGYKFSFSKRVKNYNLLINKFTNKLDLKATPENENATVSIEGNDNLKKDSIIKIVVTAEDESKSIYTIKIGYKKFNMIPYIVLIIVILSVSMLIRDSKLHKKNNKTINIDKAKYPEKEIKSVSKPEKIKVAEENKPKTEPAKNNKPKQQTKPKSNSAVTNKSETPKKKTSTKKKNSKRKKKSKNSQKKKSSKK